MHAEHPFPDEPDCLLARIDREIEALLRDGRLSRLDYDLVCPPTARVNRLANLKALLAARRHYRAIREDSLEN